uniref:Ribonuclease H-like domain-containing protein n=1 Tax=Tanacetum cinerariifolium TaxID=118510 RepID=A0A6L2N0V8_TANCI|nr:ribonuclease H-like domain-containing protein [Tanacetum cinerariifolium]
MSAPNSIHNSDDEGVEDLVTLICKLDISDPSHLHPNDSNALIVVSIKLKGTENYQVWSCAMLFALEGKNKMGFINGSCRRSNTDEVLGKQWDRFLMGLDDYYMQIRSSILSREILPDVRSAYATISSEESHRVASGSIVGSSQRNRAPAFVSNMPNRGVVQMGQSSNTAPRPNNFNYNRQGGGANQHITYTDKELDNVLDISYLKMKVAKGNKIIVAFDESRCYFLNQDLNLRNILGTGNQCEGLYYYNDQEMPSDDERVDPNLNSNNKSQSASSRSFESGRDANTADFSVNFENDADSSDDIFPLRMKGLRHLKKMFFLRSMFPRNYNDFVVDSKVKYGIEKYVSLYIQLDVNNAFLYGDLDEIVYMKSPEGKSKSSYSLYTKSDKGVFLAFLVYMDDIIITGNNVSKIKKFKVFLKFKFVIKDLEKLKYIPDIEVIDTEKGICLNQRKYVIDLLSEYGMIACKPVNTPLMSKLIISNKATEKDPILDNVTDYQKLMGKLIYLTNTSLDISYVVHCLSQFMYFPLKSHLKTTFKILRYLKGCPRLGIHIIKDSGMSLNAYSNVDWAKCVVTRKSVTGYCVFLNNSLVSWKSKKHNTLSKSFTEAEYRALASVTSEVVWILKILKDLKIEIFLPVNLHYDSNFAIKIAANLTFHERTKHIEIDLHFVREKILKGVVKTIKVESANQSADIFTNGLDTL